MLATVPLLSSGARCLSRDTVPTQSQGLLSRQQTSGLAFRVLPGKDSATATGECVGVLLPEHVTHTAARDDLQAAAALPHSE